MVSNETRCGYVSIIGAPNAGKSTLLNRLTGAKIAIVTPKVQTTRNRILGMAVHGGTQLIYIDTPGIFAARERFEKAMVASAYSGAGDGDVILLLVDAYKGMTQDVEAILERLSSYETEKILVLNKVDKCKKEDLLALSQSLFDTGQFSQCFMISALKEQGIEDVRDLLVEKMPNGPWLYPEDQMTDIPLRQLASEITREKLFMQLRQELPYSVAVETETWEEKQDGSIKIEQVVYVRTESQKMIVIGKKGSMLKTIGEKARAEIGRMMDTKIHLFLFVKVAENWKENPEFYQTIGLEYKK